MVVHHLPNDAAYNQEQDQTNKGSSHNTISLLGDFFTGRYGFFKIRHGAQQQVEHTSQNHAGAWYIRCEGNVLMKQNQLIGTSWLAQRKLGIGN